MMEYFRRFLIFLRKKDNEEMKPMFFVRLFIISFSSILIGVLIDLFLPFNFFLNALRGFVANATAFSSYSIMYLIGIKYKKVKLKEDRYYKPVRKRFSYKQRVNVSIVIGTLSGLLGLFVIQENFAFTLVSAFLITTVIILIAFSRRNRDEFLRDIYEIPDTRDLEFMQKGKRDDDTKDEK